MSGMSRSVPWPVCLNSFVSGPRKKKKFWNISTLFLALSWKKKEMKIRSCGLWDSELHRVIVLSNAELNPHRGISRVVPQSSSRNLGSLGFRGYRLWKSRRISLACFKFDHGSHVCSDGSFS